MRKFWSGPQAALFLLFAAYAAVAEPWPSGPVRIIAPFAPGGTADVFSRIMAEHFSTVFRKSFYVETRPGAGGMIGSQIAALAPPDGHTLVMAGNASHIVAPAFSPAPLYDGVKDFTQIALIGGSPVGLVVNPALPVNNFAEFLAYVKNSREPLDYTSSGIGTNGFLFGEEFAAKEGLKLNHIPYKGGGPAMIDLVAGHIKIATVTFASGAGQVRAGKLKALAVSADQRLTGFPDIPTFKELGYPEMVSLSWFALAGPKGLPRDIVDALNREVAIVLQRPDIKARLDQDAIEALPMSPDGTTKYFELETARWAPLAAAFRNKGYKAE
jgi:tripartite-type tricarboxylate transporter receptor subunit TctC